MLSRVKSGVLDEFAYLLARNGLVLEQWFDDQTCDPGDVEIKVKCMHHAT